MNILAPLPKPRKIAVIGGGISGMGAAYKMSKSDHVVLFEAEARLGGHARTVLAGRSGHQPVDMGFIVFNYANYPSLTNLFEELDVPVTKSNMSFGASVRGGRVEYALASLDSMFAQRRNLLDPRFLRMCRDIFKFNSKGLDIARGSDLSIGEFLKVLGTGEWFKEYYLLPLSGAIWSTPKEKIMDFPAASMMQFFENHALLSATGQHQWYTVQGGSVEYVRRLEARMLAKGVDIQLNAPVSAVTRQNGQVSVTPRGGVEEIFDEVIFATHSDDTLALLADARLHEKDLLGAIAYQPNDVVLHCDTSVMPRSRKCWSSWVYTERSGQASQQLDLTYWMNSLQPIPKDDPLFVTLNSTQSIREDFIYDQTTLRHPVYDAKALQAQKLIKLRNGENNTWFCGAWMKHGFHEDGLSSALDVAEQLGTGAALTLAAE